MINIQGRPFFLSAALLILLSCSEKPESDAAPHIPTQSSLTLHYAVGFTVEFRDRLKVVRVGQPWQNAQHAAEYILVPRGTAPPSGYRKESLITVPVNNCIALSTTFLAFLETLGQTDKLIALDNGRYVNSPNILKKIEENKIKEVGSGSQLNIEKVLSLSPELVFAYAMGDPAYDVHSQLTRAGIPVILNAAHLEETPLGRTEWIKFMALFFDAEKTAAAVFDSIAAEYRQLAVLTQHLEDRPAVFCNAPFRGGPWFIPGGKSFVANALADAGARYLWGEDKSSGSLPLSFESVYERAAGADIWLNQLAEWKTLHHVRQADNRYIRFKAYRQKQIFNNNARQNSHGGNDIYENGIIHPEWVLADLIKIFHPSLLPHHNLIFYRRLE